MKTSSVILFLLCLFFCAAPPGFADGLNNNEVQFTGSITSVTVNGEGLGTLFVALDTINLRVIVNSKTIIQDSANAVINMDRLDSGMTVEVTGKFSSSGILAARVHVVENGSDFTVRGHITAIQFQSETHALISLLGITVSADAGGDSPVLIQLNGTEVPLSDLKVGTKIEASGKISTDGTWIADQITVLSSNGKKGLVFFEGKVEAYDPGAGEMDVAVTGATGNLTKVVITPETEIKGNIVAGAYVFVIGTLNPDLSLTASEIRVLAALEIKPDERKLAVGGTATFSVKLRESPLADVPVALSIDNDTVLQLNGSSSLTIPAGEQTADFQVTGAAVGTAIITAAALGEEATATVVVGQLPEDDSEPPAGAVRIAFSPDHIKMNPNEVREVVLLIQPPQKDEVELVLTSSDETILPVPTTRHLSKGAATFKVAISSTGKTGTASIIAALPAALGGGTAELVVEVEAKKGSK